MNQQAPNQEINLHLQSALRLPSARFRQSIEHLKTDSESAPLRRSLITVNNLASENRTLRRLVNELQEVAYEVSLEASTDLALPRILGLTRQLLGVDAAYLVEVQSGEEAVSSILMSDGIWTQEFQEATSSNSGLANRIFELDSPLQVANYLMDDTFIRSENLDKVVKREGFRAFLGVPFDTSDDFGYILFIADRHERVYPSSDIYVLEKIAWYSSAILRLCDRESNHSNKISRLKSDLTTREKTIERLEVNASELNKLFELANRPDPIQEILTYIEARFSSSINLIDLTSYSKASNPTLSKKLYSELKDWLQSVDTAGKFRTFSFDGMAFQSWALFNGATPWGALVMESHGADSFQPLLVQKAARLLSFPGILSPKRTDESLSWDSEALFHLLRFGYSSLPEALKQRLQSISISPGRSCKIIALRCDWHSWGEIHQSIYDLLPSGVIYYKSSNMVYFFATAQRIDRVVSLLNDIFTFKEKGLLGFVSDQFDCSQDLENITYSCHRYLNAVTHLQVSTKNVVFSKQNLPFWLLALGNISREDQIALIDETLGPILEHDKMHGSDLFTTLKLTASYEFSASRVARELNLHVNTIRQRLRKIDEVLGDDWRTGHGLLNLHFALVSKITSEEPLLALD